MVHQRVLVIDDEPDILDLIREILETHHYEVKTSSSPLEAQDWLEHEAFDVVLTDVHMPGKTGIRLLEDLKASRGKAVPPFVFITGNPDPELIERASQVGAVDVIVKPFDETDILNVLKRMSDRKEDVLRDIMGMVESISGVKLGPDKEQLVKTRLHRRARFLGLADVADYYNYFRDHRQDEVAHLISLMTTHHTFFFRESDHFDVLMDTFFPKMLAEGRKDITIWSAACSTGEEAYSIAICYLEFLRQRGLNPDEAPRLKIIGSDIDFQSVEKAGRGIYELDKVKSLHPQLIQRWFHKGTGDLARLVKVKDDVHRLCSFRQWNLLSPHAPITQVDAIFLRNVLIYFRPTDIIKIVERLSHSLQPWGLLFIGHSEALDKKEVPFKPIGKAIYALDEKSWPSIEAPTRPSLRYKVLVVSQHSTQRQELHNILSSQHEFQIIGEWEDLSQKNPTAEQEADILIINGLSVPDRDHLASLRSMPVLILTHDEDSHVASVLAHQLTLDRLEVVNFQTMMDHQETFIRFVQKMLRPSAGHRSRKNEAIHYHPTPGQNHLIVVGASTGGIGAIRELLRRFPAESPPVVIVQHIPPGYTKTFAERLNGLCAIKVREAQQGMRVEAGHAYIASGGAHLVIKGQDGRWMLQTTEDEPVNRHRPSVDVLFESAARLKGVHKLVAVLLTGMGNDGAKGLLNLRQIGARTLVEAESSCVVYGMPKAAVDLGAAEFELHLDELPQQIFKLMENGQERSISPQKTAI